MDKRCLADETDVLNDKTGVPEDWVDILNE